MGMPEHLITRHPFPGPGLAVEYPWVISLQRRYAFFRMPMISISVVLHDYKVKLEW